MSTLALVTNRRRKLLTRQIVKLSEELRSRTDEELQRQARDLRWRVKAGIPLKRLLVEAYALVREAARRAIGLEHYPVQILGGIALFEGGIAEMQTGEGKTLTGVLPVFLRGLEGKGAHVVTVNDYLASRDARTMGPIYEFLGLSVGCVQAEDEPDQRREAYQKDITYGTAKEFGFDYLRDRLRLGMIGLDEQEPSLFERPHITSDPPVQRGHHFALIDEVDSVLLDEARTPLIIGLVQPNDPATISLLRWCNRAVTHLKLASDFLYEPDHRVAHLTDAGCRKLLLMAKPSLLNSVDTERIFSYVEKALVARFGFQCDRDYVIVKDEVVIVDESTGRTMEGRKWQDGLHQSVEAKEHLPITAATGQAARITVQSFYRLYTHLAGMTGTAVQGRREFRKTFHLGVTRIPTHRPCVRKGFPPRIFTTQSAKYSAMVEEIGRLRAAGRAILVGTPSVDASETLGKLLTERHIPHVILNARFHEQEAEIVAQAGQSGRVTIATNMAGRGTDIHLDDDVRAGGGLHVMATEMHSSYRIDRQLVGRAARQGDPGTFQFWLSLEDELFRVLKPKTRDRLRARAAPDAHGELSRKWLRVFRKTQRFLEKLEARQRRDLLQQEKQRITAYRQMGLDPCLELTE